MTELFVLIGVLFVCIMGSGFAAWALKSVPWWLVGVISALVSVSAVLVWLLWLYGWQIQNIQEDGLLNFKWVALLIILTFLCSVIPVLLSAFVGSRTQKAWRVGIYGFGIFSVMFLIVTAIVIAQITWQFAHW